MREYRGHAGNLALVDTGLADNYSRTGDPVLENVAYSLYTVLLDLWQMRHALAEKED